MAKGYPPNRNRPVTGAGEVGRIARDVQKQLELKKPDSNVIFLGGSTTSPGTGIDVSYTAWFPALANQYTTYPLDVIDDDGDEHMIWLVGRNDAGDTSPRPIPCGPRDNVPGEFFYRWYKDPADSILYVRLWNGVQDLDIRAFFV